MLTNIWNFIGIAQCILPNDSDSESDSDDAESEESEGSEDPGYVADVNSGEEENDEWDGIKRIERVGKFVGWRGWCDAPGPGSETIMLEMEFEVESD